MRYVALAAGFDGTLARNGRCEVSCIEALRALSASGRKLLLVTSRQLRELLEIFPEARMFDFIVAENGAVMHRPATRQSEILAQAPPEILLQELRRRHVTPLSVGSSVVTVAHAHHAQVMAALRKLHLDFQLVSRRIADQVTAERLAGRARRRPPDRPGPGRPGEFPGECDALMLLPPGVDKASGVRAALRELGISVHNLVAIGDGESDLALFDVAEHAVAVRNADAKLRRAADHTTRGAYGDGFLELATDLMAMDRAWGPAGADSAANPMVVRAGHRHRIALGAYGEDRRELCLVPGRDSLLVSGPAGSGKAAICNRLLAQMLARGYQCCVIGATLASGIRSSGLVAFGDAHEAPRVMEILSGLEQPVVSTLIDLGALAMEARATFTGVLLPQLQTLHDRSGRPHAVFIDQAHCCPAGEHLAALQRAQITVVYASEPGAARRPDASQAIAAGGGACRISVFSPEEAAGGRAEVASVSMPASSSYWMTSSTR